MSEHSADFGRGTRAHNTPTTGAEPCGRWASTFSELGAEPPIFNAPAARTKGASAWAMTGWQSHNPGSRPTGLPHQWRLWGWAPEAWGRRHRRCCTCRWRRWYGNCRQRQHRWGGCVASRACLSGGGLCGERRRGQGGRGGGRRWHRQQGLGEPARKLGLGLFVGPSG